MVDAPNKKPNAIQVLRGARALLQERGWLDKRVPPGSLFGPEEGPLTLQEAIWRASIYGPENLVAMDALDPAVVALGKTLWPDAAHPGFQYLCPWAREDGRTQAEVLRLFDATATRIVGEIEAFLCSAE